MNIEITPVPYSGLRLQAARFIERPAVTTFIVVLILINAITLGMETSAAITNSFGPLLVFLDTAILIIFTLELIIKLYAYRLDFFRSGWNLFDLAIVVIAWVPTSGPFAILRALRILRVLRLLSVVPQMRRVISAIGHSIPGMLSVIGVLCILFYVSAVLTTKLFGQHTDPQLQEWFGSIGASAYTLFQIMTLESWSMGIVRPVMTHYPWAWLFFVPFIIVTSFAVLNLFIGIIVDAMQMVQQATRNDDAGSQTTDDHTTVTAPAGTELQQQLTDIQQSIARIGDALEEIKKP